jgi:hypothetical protein
MQQVYLQQCYTVCTHISHSIIPAIVDFADVSHTHAHTHTHTHTDTDTLKHKPTQQILKAPVKITLVIYQPRMYSFLQCTHAPPITLYVCLLAQRLLRTENYCKQIFRISEIVTSCKVTFNIRCFAFIFIDIDVRGHFFMLQSWTLLLCVILPLTTVSHQISPTSSKPSHHLTKRNSTNKTLSPFLPSFSNKHTVVVVLPLCLS